MRNASGVASPFLYGNTTHVYGNNDRGDLVGAYTITDGPIGTFVRLDGAVIPLSGFAPWDINNLGRMVGTTVGAVNSRGIHQDENGQRTFIDHPGVTATAVYGLNDAGYMVGCAEGHGFLRRPNGTFLSIAYPGATNSCAYGINESGQIVGIYWNQAGTYHGFLDLSDAQFVAAAPPGGGGGDTSPPTVSIVTPSNGATVAGSITLNATASDNVGVVGVQFKVDGQNVGAEQTAPPYTVSWNTSAVTDGVHTVAAVARDAAGNQATASVSVTVANSVQALSAQFVNPAHGSTVTGLVTVTVAAAGGAGGYTYAVAVGGTSIYSGANASFTWNSTTVSNGSHTLTATVTDASSATASASITITVNNAPGMVGYILEPASGASLAQSTTVSMQVTGSTTTWKTFNLKVDGTQQIFNHATPSSTDTYNWSLVNWSNGPHTLTLTVSNSASQQAITEIPITINNVIAAAITSPSAQTTVSGVVTVNMQVTGNTSTWGHTFNLKIDGVLRLNKYVAATTHSWAWDTTTMQNGNHALLLTVTDGVGKSTTHHINVMVAN